MVEIERETDPQLPAKDHEASLGHCNDLPKLTTFMVSCILKVEISSPFVHSMRVPTAIRTYQRRRMPVGKTVMKSTQHW